MLPQLQAGGVVSPELLLIAFLFVVQVVPLVVAFGFVHRDAKRRGSEHALAWAVGALFGGPVTWALYYFVRDEVGNGTPSASG